MKTNTTIQITAMSFAFLMTCSLMLWAEPLGTTFTYQGRLLNSNVAADGQYDFQFKLYSDPNMPEGSQASSTVAVEDVEVIDGYFIAELDFGSDIFNGQKRFLQIAVRPYNSTAPEDYVSLIPLQPLTASPYTQYALKSGGFSLPLSLTSDSSDALFRIDGTGSGYSIYGTAQSGGSTAVYGYHAIGGNMGYLGTDTAGVKGYSASNYAGLFDGKTKVTGDLTVEGTANAGIGTAAPAAKLHVSNSTSSYGMLRIENSAAGDNEATMGFKEGSDAASSDIWVAGVGGWGNTNDFVLGRGAAKILVEPDGDVGIGTITPSQKLEVSGAVKASRTGADGPHLIIHDSNGSNDRPGIQFTNNSLHYIGGDDGSNEYFGFYSQYGNNRIYDAVVNIYGKATANWGTYLSLTHDGANGIIGTDSGHILLLPNQNVAIGTTTPSGKLDVYTNLNDYGLYSRNEKSGNIYSYGVFGTASNSESILASFSVGVCGNADSSNSENYGIIGRATGNTARYSYGVHGTSSSASGNNFGLVGLATTPTAGKNYGLYAHASNNDPDRAVAGFFYGNVYVTDNVSASSFTDRTPYPKDLATAYAAVTSMERLPDGQYSENDRENQLDHSALSPFIRSEDGNRDLSATVSCQNEVLKDLIRRTQEFEEARVTIRQLEQKLVELQSQNSRLERLEQQMSQLTGAQ